LSKQLEQQEAAMAAFLDHLDQVPVAAFRPDVFVAHDIAGRLRVIVPTLKGDDRRAAAVCSDLRRLPDVQALQFNALTGSLLVEYDGLVCSREAILHTLDDAGYMLVRQLPHLPVAPAIPRSGNLQHAAGR
jgi:Heavy metal associated domain 2